MLAANGVPERNAPSFHPRRIEPVGAAPFTAIERRAVLVMYRGDVEGDFAVVSLQGSLDDLSPDAGTIEFQGRRYTTFLRPGPNGAALHGVGKRVGGRLVYVVGTQPMDKLAELAAVIPDVDS